MKSAPLAKTPATTAGRDELLKNTDRLCGRILNPDFAAVGHVRGLGRRAELGENGGLRHAQAVARARRIQTSAAVVRGHLTNQARNGRRSSGPGGERLGQAMIVRAFFSRLMIVATAGR